MSRMDDKIKEISRFLEEIKSIVPSSIEEYKSNLEKKAACERYVEKIVEAAVDLAFLLIKTKKLKIPEDDIDAFNVLLNGKIIENDLADRMKNAKGMRNIISHQYGNIDDEIIFESISRELDKDMVDFIARIKRVI